MPLSFIIMQIGDSDIDKVCETAIVPALKDCGLEPRRVDKHNKGGLLKSEIINFIQEADIIIADLTNERPNCYLEIGYTMGFGKYNNLIMTSREDHNPDSPNYKRGGPKIHFDLIGYDILFWHSDRIEEFQKELEKRVRRRLAILAPGAEEIKSPWDDIWIQSQRDDAFALFPTTKKRGFMEIRFALSPPKPNKNQRELYDAAKGSTTRTFGWPIGVFLTRPDYAPKPKADAIVAKILTEDSIFDYWTIRRNGDSYLLKTLFEDERDPQKLFFDTRIIRITETLIYCRRLYSRLNIDSQQVVNVAIRHGGLKGRVLKPASPDRLISGDSRAEEDEIEVVIDSTLSGLESNLVGLVKELCSPLFMLFDFSEFGDGIYEDIVENFVKGRT